MTDASCFKAIWKPLQRNGVRSMRLYISLLIVFLVSACSVTGELVEMQPQHGQQSQVGVGDALYIYSYKPETLVDYMNGQTTSMGGGRAFKQEILYSGMSGGQLNFAYREFADDWARPAFSQEASYDYSPNTSVTFKGARVKVLSADNQSIKYVIEEGFNNEKEPDIE